MLPDNVTRLSPGDHIGQRNANAKDIINVLQDCNLILINNFEKNGVHLGDHMTFSGRMCGFLS